MISLAREHRILFIQLCESIPVLDQSECWVPRWCARIDWGVTCLDAWDSEGGRLLTDGHHEEVIGNLWPQQEGEWLMSTQCKSHLVEKGT